MTCNEVKMYEVWKSDGVLSFFCSFVFFGTAVAEGDFVATLKVTAVLICEGAART
jgi:hypothetical protein